MARYILSRIGQTIPTLLLISIGVFGLTHIIPGDPVDAMLGENATPEAIASLRDQYNLNEPVHVQYLIWLWDMVRGDFGTSITTRAPVADIIFGRLPVTLTLAGLATLVAVIIAIPAGVAAAIRRGGLAEKAVLFGSLVGVSIPSFFLGILLILLFAVHLGWFPAVGNVGTAESPSDYLRSFVLPAISLGLLYTAIVARMSRASMLEVLGQDYITTGRAAGLKRSRILYRHALTNAIVPIITVVGLNLGSLLGGSVVTEFVFNLPGIGTMLIDAIDRRDYPVVQSAVLLISLIYIIVNLLVDLLYAVFDPKVRYTKGEAR